LATAVLAGVASAAGAARELGVSRKFVTRQRQIAQGALEEAFVPTGDGDRVLLHLAVTPNCIRRLVLAAVLIGHASDRDAQELIQALLGQAPSLGTIHNVLHQAAADAQRINAGEDLSAIRVGAFDEIYECRRPTLVGVDLHSTYCFLLSPEDNCDGDTWGTHLLELIENRHLRLERSIADGGKGLRLGHELAGCGFACDYDVFHALKMFRDVSQFTENRAWGALRTVEKLKRRKDRTGRRAAPTPQRLAAVEKQTSQAIALADDLALLYEWMRTEVLGLAGESLPVRRELFDFVLGELEMRLPLCAHRLQPLIKTLRNHRELLLGFAGVLDQRLRAIAQELAVSPAEVREACRLEALSRNHSLYWQRRGPLMARLGPAWASVEAAVRQAMAQTPRASSLVENLNGRLRCYFYLWRGARRPYLELLRFYLNHRPYARSAHPERVGKSPWQLLSGQSHPFWLDMLPCVANPSNN
jgi:hypothetical protein